VLSHDQSHDIIEHRSSHTRWCDDIKRCWHAGVYNEEVFSSLDWILDQASQRGLHLILPIEVQLTFALFESSVANLADSRGSEPLATRASCSVLGLGASASCSMTCITVKCRIMRLEVLLVSDLSHDLTS